MSLQRICFGETAVKEIIVYQSTFLNMNAANDWEWIYGLSPKIVYSCLRIYQLRINADNTKLKVHVMKCTLCE